MNNDAIDAKAHAELTVVLARLGVKYADLTQFERVLWTSGFRIGLASGALDASKDALDIVSGMVK